MSEYYKFETSERFQDSDRSTWQYGFTIFVMEVSQPDEDSSVLTVDMCLATRLSLLFY